MRPIAASILLGVALTALAGCATTPAEQEAIRKAWAERDAEREAECRRKGLGFAVGGCLSGGP